MRIASLLPAATEWICAIGGRHLLVGRSHACNMPESVRVLPSVTVPSRLQERESISRVLAHELIGKLFFMPDVEGLRASQPDLVVMQETCTLCADDVMPLVSSRTREWEIFAFAPPTRFKRVLDNVLRMARRIGMQEEAYHYIGDAEVRLRHLQHQMEKIRSGARPRVLVLVHGEPPVVGGYWIADQVWHAGGTPELSVSGVAPRRIRTTDLATLDPDVLLVVAPELSEEVAAHVVGTRAYEEGKVYQVTDPTLFLRPGPRLYTGIEALASVLYPSLVPTSSFIQPWQTQPPLRRSGS